MKKTIIIFEDKRMVSFYVIRQFMYYKMNLNRLEVCLLQHAMHLFLLRANITKSRMPTLAGWPEINHTFIETLKRVSPGINPTFASREATATRSISSRW